jgi:hypothetical protein
MDPEGWLPSWHRDPGSLRGEDGFDPGNGRDLIAGRLRLSDCLQRSC